MVADQHGYIQEGGSLPQFPQVDNLSHDSLIKRAASLVTDSSNTFLSQTTLAYRCHHRILKRAEHASVTVRTNIQVALSQVEEAQKLSADADKKLAVRL
ncbi:hypothetical protein INR49_026374, partial [Caranx melampygus]